ALSRRRLALLIAQMAGQFRLQAPLQGRLQQRRQQPVRAGDLDLAGDDLGEQLVQRTAGLELRDELVTRRRGSALFIGHPHLLLRVLSARLTQKTKHAFKKYPEVMIELSEGGTGSIPYFLERVDRTYDMHSTWTHQDFGGK